MKYLTITIISLLSIFQLAAQDASRTYKIDWKYDAPLVAIGVGGTILGFSAISAQDGVDSMALANLDKNDINSFDRSVAGNFDLKAEKQSDILFFGAFPYGLVLLADKKARQEAGAIGLMYLEVTALSSMGYSLAAGNSNRFRPYTYRKEPLENESDNEELQQDRRSLHARNSFWGGHPATVTASTVFVAKVYSDLHPESNFKYALWGVAAGASIATGALRIKAGKHFITDVATGILVSGTIGWLVPHLHKVKDNSSSFKIMPYTGESTGLYMAYTFNKKKSTLKDFGF